MSPGPITRVVVVPPVPALLPAYAALVDPVADLRAACLEAVSWVVEGADRVEVRADDGLGDRVARHLLDACGFRGSLAAPSVAVLVLANGSARRGEQAPGYLDERSFAFDTAVEDALRAGDTAALADLDEHLAADLLTAGSRALRSLAGLSVVRAELTYAADPYGVRYWVARWETAPPEKPGSWDGM